MKIYNNSKIMRLLSFPAMALLVLIPYLIFTDPSRNNWFFVIIGVPMCLAILVSFRDTFCPFVIEERGITSKMPFRNIFIAWDDFKYIRVGEWQYNRGKDFRFILCFSKVSLKTVFLGFGAAGIFARQNKKHFYIVYRDGLLEEVLKYVDEKRIQDVSRIKGKPDAGEVQKASTSLLGGRLDLKDRDWW